MAEPIKVLFVCLGNIVRSPLAEAMMKHLALEQGNAEKYIVDSAGTASYHIGESPDARMRKVAANNGLIYDGKGRQFVADDFSSFDIIIAMDNSNMANILSLAKNPQEIDQVHLLRDFDPVVSNSNEVPDPYYGGIDGFEHVFDIVKRSIEGFLKATESGEVNY